MTYTYGWWRDMMDSLFESFGVVRDKNFKNVSCGCERLVSLVIVKVPYFIVWTQQEFAWFRIRVTQLSTSLSLDFWHRYYKSTDRGNNGRQDCVGSRPIASAVILPPHPPDIDIVPTKRPKSPSTDSTSKRARLEHEDGSETKNLSTETSHPIVTSPSITERNEERRKSTVVEEKKRGQRLLGSLLNALSQSSQNGQHKMKAHSQKRQLKQASIQKTLNDVQTGARVTEILEIQKQEQNKFNEETPWELLPEQKERIDVQIASVSQAIESEISEFRRKSGKNKDLEEEEENGKEISEEVAGEPRAEPRIVTPKINDAHDTAANTDQNSEKADVKVEERDGDKEEHNGEVMVENEEDTVIY
ncbi:putative pinin sdk mema domain-containing protein [Golovinomyces cichoracearum]|uniref:Putative pinin sdk mema domain-containing protein n=1 Tax=Golovinomyces cichoracearum TaxID=62708 RepID=A0A420IZX3_9PEZI|nr:putative pinin sdk mema domain-containing protein [Golovinomyces cichoracearum]